MVSITEKSMDRVAAAYHEAGHAVMAYRVGWWINDDGIEIDRHQHTGLSFPGEDTNSRHAGMVCLAGWEAEHQFHGKGGMRNAASLLDDLHRVIDGTGCDDWGDVEAMFQAMMTDNPGQPPAHYLRDGIECLHKTRIELRNPVVWAAISRLAQALTERGSLDPESVERIIGPMTQLSANKKLHSGIIDAKQ